MEQRVLTITENEALSPDIMRMELQTDAEFCGKLLPGQFLNIRLDGLFLRRPISFCDVCGDRIVIAYKTVGRGTEKLAAMKPGERLDVLLPLGNGFSLDDSGNSPLLIGGGVGIAPLYYLARSLRGLGKAVTAVLAFNTASEIFLKEEFASLGCRVIICTLDGSEGCKGFASAAMGDLEYTYTYVCGPEPMLRALHKDIKGGAQYSFEARMGCGFGACMGCSCRTVTGSKRICREGPVMRKEDVLWED